MLTSRGPRPRRSAEPAAGAGTRVLSRSLVGSRGWKAAGGTRTAPIAALTAGPAAVRCARYPAGRLLPCPPAVPPLAPPRAGTRPCARLQAAPLPLLRHLPLPRGRPLPSERLCSKSRLRRPGEPCGRRMMLRPPGSRSCPWFLRLRSQTSFCLLRRSYSFSLALCISPSLFYLFFTPPPFPPRLFFFPILHFYLGSL